MRSCVAQPKSPVSCLSAMLYSAILSTSDSSSVRRSLVLAIIDNAGRGLKRVAVDVAPLLLLSCVQSWSLMSSLLCQEDMMIGLFRYGQRDSGPRCRRQCMAFLRQPNLISARSPAALFCDSASAVGNRHHHIFITPSANPTKLVTASCLFTSQF